MNKHAHFRMRSKRRQTRRRSPYCLMILIQVWLLPVADGGKSCAFKEFMAKSPNALPMRASKSRANVCLTSD